MRSLVLVLLLFALGGGCSSTPSPPSAALSATSTDTTPTPLPTPTMRPTTVPGTSADQHGAMAMVEQFGEAVVRGDELVALLVLSPSAQKVVAADGLDLFLGQSDRPAALRVRAVHVDGDVATAECTVSNASGQQPLRLRLVRLDGQWRVDDRIDQ